MSGIGMFHDTYSNELDELTDVWVASQLEKTMERLLEESELILEYAKLREQEDNERNKYLKISNDYRTAAEITELIMCDDIIGDFLVFDFPLELKEEVGKMDIEFLVKLGQQQAKEEVRQEEIARQKGAKEQKENREKAEKTWRRICTIHKIKYQKNMPQKMEKPYFDQYVYPIIENTYKEDEDILSIRLIGEYLSFQFSNSVAYKLMQYKG
jgi:hypothetical protein